MTPLLGILAGRGLKPRANADEVIREDFLGESWTLIKSSKSVYHSPDGTGDDIWKWVSDSGREVVHDAFGNIERSDRYMGTYNFAPLGKDEDHMVLDVLPYVLWGNTPNDPTNRFQRIHPIWGPPLSGF